MSCGGQDWQGGLGLTLVDSLDMLLLLNRRGDVQEALVRLEHSLSFDKDVKVGEQACKQQHSTDPCCCGCCGLLYKGSSIFLPVWAG